MRVMEFERYEEEVLEARVHVTHFGEWLLSLILFPLLERLIGGKNGSKSMGVDKGSLGGVENTSARGANGEASGLIWGVWLMIGGVIDSAGVVLRVVEMRLF
ncbi:hypothetical protein Tco_0065646 [Tanacetum coccineum]